MTYIYEITNVSKHSNYDHCYAMVVIAKDSKRARRIAAENAVDEGSETWLSRASSKIQKIGSTEIRGRPVRERLVIRDVMWG